MERLKLEVATRNSVGGLSKMRAEGLVPGILYGKKREPITIQVVARTLEKATSTHAGLNAIFDLTIDGKQEGLVRVREFQADPLKRNFIHVDLQTIDLTEKIEVEVPVHVVGKAAGVKEGGILEQMRRTLHLRCLVTQIPDKIDVDVSELIIGQSVHADEIKLPAGVEFPHETNFIVVAVVPPAKEEVAPVVAAVLVEGAAAAPAEGAAAAPEAGKEGGKKE